MTIKLFRITTHYLTTKYLRQLNTQPCFTYGSSPHQEYYQRFIHQIIKITLTLVDYVIIKIYIILISDIYECYQNQNYIIQGSLTYNIIRKESQLLMKNELSQKMMMLLQESEDSNQQPQSKEYLTTYNKIYLDKQLDLEYPEHQTSIVQNRLQKNIQQLTLINRSLSNSRSMLSKQKKTLHKSKSIQQIPTYQQPIKKRTKILNQALDNLRQVEEEVASRKNYQQSEDFSKNQNHGRKNSTTTHLKRLQGLLKDIKKCHRDSVRPISSSRHPNISSHREKLTTQEKIRQINMETVKKQLNQVKQQFKTLKATNQSLLSLSRSNHTISLEPYQQPPHYQAVHQPIYNFQSIPNFTKFQPTPQFQQNMPIYRRNPYEVNHHQPTYEGHIQTERSRVYTYDNRFGPQNKLGNQINRRGFQGYECAVCGCTCRRKIPRE